MRVDAHQHFWIYSPEEFAWIDDSMKTLRRDFLPEHLQPELKQNGVDGSIAVQARPSIAETEWLLNLAGDTPFILGVVGWVDLRAADAGAQLRRLRERPKLCGIRHLVQSEPEDRFMLGSDFLRGIAQLEPLGLAYDLLIYPRHLPAAVELAARFPRQRFVLDHLAKPPIRTGEIRGWERDIRRLARASNASCKLSGLVTEAERAHWKEADFLPYLDVVFDCFGADRLLFGSDWPVCLGAARYADVLKILLTYIQELSPAAQEAVLGGNAFHVYRLNRKETHP